MISSSASSSMSMVRSRMCPPSGWGPHLNLSSRCTRYALWLVERGASSSCDMRQACMKWRSGVPLSYSHLCARWRMQPDIAPYLRQVLPHPLKIWRQSGQRISGATIKAAATVPATATCLSTTATAAAASNAISASATTATAVARYCQSGLWWFGYADFEDYLWLWLKVSFWIPLFITFSSRLSALPW